MRAQFMAADWPVMSSLVLNAVFTHGQPMICTVNLIVPGEMSCAW